MFRLCSIIFTLLIAPLSGKYIQQDIRDNWYNHQVDQLDPDLPEHPHRPCRLHRYAFF